MTKDELLNKILDKEKQLDRAQSESDCWNNGKYKRSSNAPISKIFVSSIESEIASLRAELSEFESK